jgi:hypothetical protein
MKLYWTFKKVEVILNQYEPKLKSIDSLKYRTRTPNLVEIRQVVSELKHSAGYH